MVTMDPQITNRFNHSPEEKKHLPKMVRGAEKIALQLRLIALFDTGKESIHIDMDDFPRCLVR